MIIYMHDGRVIKGRPTMLCTGIRAERIEMEQGDFGTLLNLSRIDPERFRTVMLQLDARFDIPAELTKDTCREFWFTFGQDHRHEVEGKVFDKDCVATVRAADMGEARDTMFRHFGDKWAFSYQNPPDMSYFPRGFIDLN